MNYLFIYLITFPKNLYTWECIIVSVPGLLSLALVLAFNSMSRPLSDNVYNHIFEWYLSVTYVVKCLGKPIP